MAFGSSKNYNNNQHFGGDFSGGKCQRRYQTADYITDYQNFLKEAPLVSLNLKPDAQGRVTFKSSKLPLFNSVQIFAADELSVI